MKNKTEFLALTANLDFSLIVKKITQKDPSIAKVWTEAGAMDAVGQYKCFMYLMYKYKETSYTIVPSLEIDEIWHHHILDTRKYLQDCNDIYGYFMHHYPYLGREGKGSDEFEQLQDNFAITQRLYYEEFGTHMYAVDF